MNPVTSFALACGLTLAVGSAAVAGNYRAATYNPATDTHSRSFEWFVNQVGDATQGEVSFDYFPGATLLPATSTLSGLADGVAQIGFHTSAYNPSDLPLSNALYAGFGFIERDPYVLGAAFGDWIMHDPKAVAQYEDMGLLGIGAFSTPNYPILCNTDKPVTSVEDMKGLKVRFPGGANGKLVQDLGGVAVNIPAPEIYQALQTRQIDCAGIFAAWLNLDNSLDEVTTSVTVMEWSSIFTSPFVIVNREFWSDLTADQRAVFFEKAAEGQARLQIDYDVANQKALDTTKALGHPVVSPDDGLKQAVAKWVEHGVGDMAGVARDTYGVEDPEALFASFNVYVEKWRGLVAGLNDRHDVDELAKLLHDNMYGDLDPATYGVE